MITSFSSVIRGGMYLAFLKFSSLIKFSCIIGSQMAFFSGVNVMAPLAGRWFGVAGSCGLLLLGLATHSLLLGMFTLKSLAFYVPGFCAALYWATPHASIRLFLPLLCILLFILNPVGWQACVYTLYWLIPVCIYFLPHHTVFSQALGSTFIAHAVGSVIWIYADPMTPAIWLALIPVVLFERLLFATGMFLMLRIASVINSQHSSVLPLYSMSKE
jgi:hypothetical protein